MENEAHFDLIRKAILFIQQKHTQQPSLEDVARHVHLSKFHFQRLFRQWAGLTPKQFLQHITLESAKEALAKGRSTLGAAYEVGLSGNGRLHDLFINMEAFSPGEYKSGGQGLAIYTTTISTPFGPAVIAETDKGICRIDFPEDNQLSLYTLKKEFPKARFLEGEGEQAKRVAHYFGSWEVPEKGFNLHIPGTNFQIQVWKALLKIPSAHLLSYGDVAALIDRPGAQRAVGTAIGKNPIAYLIPCHRVIKSDGHFGNYRWLSERKVAINGFEEVVLS